MDPVEIKSANEISAETLSTLVEIGQEINSSLNLDEVLAKAAQLIKRLIDYEIFAVLLPEEGTDQLYFRFTIGYKQEVRDHWRVPWGQGITGTAAATGRAVRVGDVRNDPRYINAIEAVRSELAVPMMVGGKAIGVLDIQSHEIDYFTPEQQAILTLLATRIAGAIENARLFERARSQAETLLLLNEVGREASSILDVKKSCAAPPNWSSASSIIRSSASCSTTTPTKSFRHRLTVKYGQSVQEKLRVAATRRHRRRGRNARPPGSVPDVLARSALYDGESRDALRAGHSR